MITRQNDILKERNMYIVDFKFCSRALTQTDKVCAIRKARLSLCQWGFTLWFQEWEQSSSYQVEEMEHSGANARSVHQKVMREESNRVIVTQGEPCTGSELWKKDNGKSISYIKCDDVGVPIAPE
jgi:hypothetical protein